CGRPGFYETPGGILCIDCQLKVVQAAQARDAMLRNQMNDIMDMAEATVGVFGVLPRFQVPQPVVNRGPMTFNNIHVDRRVVGAINTGHVKQLDIAMDNVRAAGGDELVEAAARFSEAVLRAHELDAARKDEIVEQLTFVVSEALQPKPQRKRGMVKAALAAL